MKNFNRQDIYGRFRIDVLNGICAGKYPQFKDRIELHAKQWNVSKQKLFAMRLKWRCVPFLQRVVRRIQRKKHEVEKYYEVRDIAAASAITMEHIEKL